MIKDTDAVHAMQENDFEIRAGTGIFGAEVNSTDSEGG